MCLQSIQGVTMMQHRQRDDLESWLLLVGQDKAVKGYKISTDSLQAAQPHEVSELQHVLEVRSVAGRMEPMPDRLSCAKGHSRK